MTDRGVRIGIGSSLAAPRRRGFSLSMSVFRNDRSEIGRSFVANKGVGGGGSERSFRNRAFRRVSLTAYPTLLEHTRGCGTGWEKAEMGSLGFVLLTKKNREAWELRQAHPRLLASTSKASSPAELDVAAGWLISGRSLLRRLHSRWVAETGYGSTR